MAVGGGCRPIWRCLVVAFFLATASATALADEVKLPYTLDLSQPFHTRSDWWLVITQVPSDDVKNQAGAVVDQEVGAIRLCFQRQSGEICPAMGDVNQAGLEENAIARVAIMHVGATPLLLVDTQEAGCPMGGCFRVATWVWAYGAATDTFDVIFSNESSVTNNQETRFMESGPLAGDIVVALNPPFGSPPPYPYTITVYRRAGLGAYKPILHYTARSRENDGNALAVIDAEMPVIEKRLHVWRPGQALPTPKYIPPDCKTLEMRHGLEWCSRPYG